MDLTSFFYIYFKFTFPSLSRKNKELILERFSIPISPILKLVWKIWRKNGLTNLLGEVVWKLNFYI